MASRKDAQELATKLSVNVQTAGLILAFPMISDEIRASDCRLDRWFIWRTQLEGRHLSEIDLDTVLANRLPREYETQTNALRESKVIAERLSPNATEVGHWTVWAFEIQSKSYVQSVIRMPEGYQIKHLPEEDASRKASLHSSLLSENIQESDGFASLETDVKIEPQTEDELVNFAIEGATTQILVNAFERNPQNRQRCIQHWGSRCCLCAFDFGQAYGSIGEGYIHVHHLTPLSEVRDAHEVNPVDDLRPVCPNCHAMIHRKKPPYTIEELKQVIRDLGQQI